MENTKEVIFTNKVKLFSNEGDIPQLEEEINKWLSSGRKTIMHVKQDCFYDTDDQVYVTVISVWYKDNP